MKIAITADCHLTTRERNPERYSAFESILTQSKKGGGNAVVVAGDLFDESSQNYAEFDELCQRRDFRELAVWILCGNHDEALQQKSFAAENIRIVSRPELTQFGGMRALFVPYIKNKSVGEVLAGFAPQLKPDWILFGHGDYVGGFHEPNPLEPGVYMPLTRVDIDTFKPAQVFLGHIHKPMDRGVVHYVGSPCGVTVSETGRRRFLMVDTSNQKIDSITVDSEVIFYNESFVIFPVEDEQAYLRKEIRTRIEKWDLRPEEYEKVRVQVRVLGYTTDKQMLLQTLKSEFAEFGFHKNSEPDLSNVAVADDLNLAEIARRVSDWTKQHCWNSREGWPGKDEVLLQALRVIYGE